MFPLITYFRSGFYRHCLPAAITLLLAGNGGNWQGLPHSDHRSYADPGIEKICSVSLVMPGSIWTRQTNLTQMSSPQTLQFGTEVPNEKIRPFLKLPLILFILLLHHNMAYEGVYALPALWCRTRFSHRGRCHYFLWRLRFISEQTHQTASGNDFITEPCSH